MQHVIPLMSGKITFNPNPDGSVRVELEDASGGRAQTDATPDQAGTLIEELQATLEEEP